MNGGLAHLLTRLYPRAWRDRYGPEFVAFLEDSRGGVRASANVVWSALCERAFPTRGGQMDPHAHPGSLRFHSWCVRAPWAIFGLGSALVLAAAYLVACVYLWWIWTVFLPGADTPFGHPNSGPIYGFQNICFQAGKFYYFGAPILAGWGIAITAARQRVKAVWPITGLILIALMGGTAEIHASRTGVPGGLGHIRMDFFALGPSAQSVYGSLFYSLVILLLTVLPYLICRRLQKPGSLSV
ncbi:MAG TPA: hypothetical protein VG225_01825 [Terracidiphilus sp.]|nr:hypothetical protein [Terracidiphilus sp.]